MMNTVQDIRPSPLAGQWYTARPDKLRAEVGALIAAAPTDPTAAGTGNLHALLAPHAGIRYSGGIAGRAFAQVTGMGFETVIIVGPLHYALPVRGGLLSSAHDAYQTPLGTVPIHNDMLDRLGAMIDLTLIRDDPEHSIEIELPFLQQALTPGFRLIPIMMRDQSYEAALRLGKALAACAQKERVLLVASSDLSHFYRQAMANALDQKMLEAVTAMNARQVVDYDQTGEAFACGSGAIAAVIIALQAWSHGHQAHLIGYATSGDVTGDFDRVVGYGAAAFKET